MEKVQSADHRGMTMQQMIASRLAPINTGGVNYTTVPSSPDESARNWRIQGILGAKNFMGNVVTRVELPKDKYTQQNDRTVNVTQIARDYEYHRQTVMPWNSQFMKQAQTAQRLNNPAQYSAVRQKQLTPPNSYGQFYAFMHAMAAAFGTLQVGQ